MKNGAKLILEHMILYQILSDRKFWELCPEWVEWKDEGQAVHQKVVDEVLHPSAGCKACGTVKSVMKQFLMKFTRQVADWHTTDAAKLDSLVAYISKKRGYRPVPIVVNYKDAQGKIRAVLL